MATQKQLENIERQRKEKLEREHKIINGVDHKICSYHHIYFPGESPWFPATTEYFYYNDKNKTDYLHPECKRCSSKKANKWQYDNYEQALELHRQFRKTDKYDECEKRNYVKQISNRDKWRKTHPEKCREYSKMHRNHDITEKEWKGCLSVFNNQCVYCGLPFEKHIMKRNGKDILMRLHKDHVDDEGCNDLRNAVPSCQSCNSRKHQDSLDE